MSQWGYETFTAAVTVESDRPTLLDAALTPLASRRPAADADADAAAAADADEPKVYAEFRHHNYTLMEAALRRIADAYPNITRYHFCLKAIMNPLGCAKRVLWPSR